MDIKTYVQKHVRRPNGGAAANQFAVLAFDLGLKHGDGHPPSERAEFSDKIRENGPSGPWSAKPHGYRPITNPVTETAKTGRVVVVVKKDRHGQDTVLAPNKENMAERQTKIHAERSLAARIEVFAKHYFDEYDRLPASVSMYSFYSPCTKCIGYLGSLPGRIKIPLWFFSYSLPYVSEAGDEPEADTEHFSNENAAIDAVERLRSSGWHIL
jgi:hypothetical protein